MIVRLAIGLLIGAAFGALVGRTQSCQSGACPLTANPRRGAIWGGVLGLMFALSLPAAPPAPGGAGRAGSAQRDGAEGKAAIMQVDGLDQFRREVLDQPGKTVVDFYATWCPPCRMYGPTLEKMAEEKLPGVNFRKVDVDQAAEVAKDYGIEAMPTTIIFEHGKEVRRFVGVQSEVALKEALRVSS